MIDSFDPRDVTHDYMYSCGEPFCEQLRFFSVYSISLTDGEQTMHVSFFVVAKMDHDEEHSLPRQRCNYMVYNASPDSC